MERIFTWKNISSAGFLFLCLVLCPCTGSLLCLFLGSEAACPGVGNNGWQPGKQLRLPRAAPSTTAQRRRVQFRSHHVVDGVSRILVRLLYLWHEAFLPLEQGPIHSASPSLHHTQRAYSRACLPWHHHSLYTRQRKSRRA